MLTTKGGRAEGEGTEQPLHKAGAATAPTPKAAEGVVNQ